MKKKNRPIFRQFYTVEVSNISNHLLVAADSFGQCACMVQKYIDALETKEAHEIINIRRNIADVLVYDQD